MVECFIRLILFIKEGLNVIVDILLLYYVDYDLVNDVYKYYGVNYEEVMVFFNFRVMVCEVSVKFFVCELYVMLCDMVEKVIFE